MNTGPANDKTLKHDPRRSRDTSRNPRTAKNHHFSSECRIPTRTGAALAGPHNKTRDHPLKRTTQTPQITGPNDAPALHQRPLGTGRTVTHPEHHNPQADRWSSSQQQACVTGTRCQATPQSKPQGSTKPSKPIRARYPQKSRQIHHYKPEPNGDIKNRNRALAPNAGCQARRQQNEHNKSTSRGLKSPHRSPVRNHCTSE